MQTLACKLSSTLKQHLFRTEKTLIILIETLACQLLFRIEKTLIFLIETLAFQFSSILMPRLLSFDQTWINEKSLSCTESF